MPPYGMPESVEVYGGGAPSGMAQPYSVAPGSDWGTAVPAQQAVAAQGGWNIGPNGPRWIGVPSDNMGAASGAVFRTRNIANPMTLYREMGYNPNYNMPGSMAAYRNYGIPPVVTQRSPYASLAAVYGPGNSVAPLTGFPSQYPHVLNGVPQDYLAPTLSLYEIPMYQQSGLANMLMAAMMGGMRSRGAGAGGGGGGGGKTKKPDPEYQGGQAGLPTEPLLDLPGPKPIIGDGIIDTYRRRSEAIAGVPDLTGASVGDMALPSTMAPLSGPDVEADYRSRVQPPIDITPSTPVQASTATGASSTPVQRPVTYNPAYEWGMSASSGKSPSWSVSDIPIGLYNYLNRLAADTRNSMAQEAAQVPPARQTYGATVTR